MYSEDACIKLKLRPPDQYVGPMRGSKFIIEICKINVKNLLKNYDAKICDISIQASSYSVDYKLYKQ